MVLTYRNADTLNNVPVSQDKPLPVALMANSALYEPASVAVSSPGTGFAPSDTVDAAGPASVQPSVLTVTHTKAISASVAAGGTGGTPGAVTVTGTTGTGTPFQATGTISAGGALTGPLTITVAGDYTVNPTDVAAEPVTGGSLTGATVLLGMGVLTATISTPGILNAATGSVTQTDTSGDGTGAVFALSGGTEMPSALTALEAMQAAIGTASDEAGDPTVIGLLKQIAANTEPA